MALAPIEQVSSPNSVTVTGTTYASVVSQYSLFQEKDGLVVINLVGKILQSTPVNTTLFNISAHPPTEIWAAENYSFTPVHLYQNGNVQINRTLSEGDYVGCTFVYYVS